ncbi:GNAT family N-acetyltransferase [Vibrio sp. ZSDE26]|uniref:tRNA(Met) cytidine acetyltransferase TmcA n=1 Tax=Vibrio amylolyticus TaxID=2847292 RepID=A0A9X1XRC3_9VIBR|nr:GNAT family N-acetyltransferase [Vibrio amylolyticus]MCK6264174.1 GNAT family N-acetyltransferase [Vibrio amylolyticus]
MSATTTFLSQLFTIARFNHARFGVVLRGSEGWQKQAIEELVEAHNSKTIFQLGGIANFDVKHLPFKKGKQWLGQECQVLICDFSDGFDANSFSAAIGTLVGGGILIIQTKEVSQDEKNEALELDELWLEQSLNRLINIGQGESLPSLPPKDNQQQASCFSEQVQVIDKVVRVVEGHRKRPLVVTADRGRGKTSALGLACAELMKKRAINIIITAPTIATVSPLFKHATESLSTALETNSSLTFKGTNHTSTLRYVAPDELIRSNIECDFLMVDESAAIPVPMLKELVEHYHRLVFSSTIHGYEGSGRGFSLKFLPWLKEQRPSSRSVHIYKPIRWTENDPLEAWHNQSFLLDAELAEVKSIEHFNSDSLTLEKLDKSALVADLELFTQCFSLLVSAHYQTSPNDLFHLLHDINTSIYVTRWKGDCVGCLLTVEEGGLSEELTSLAQQGKRRPSGQLVSVTIANHLGISEAAKESGLRIMRIAVHPNLQGSNVGSVMLDQLQILNSKYYLSTSFGATSDLLRFWRKNQFVAIKLGSQRDKASGCYSVIMINEKTANWLERAKKLFFDNLHYRMTDPQLEVEIDVLRILLEGTKADVESLSDQDSVLLQQYQIGGASFDSVAFIIRRLVLCSLMNDRQENDNAEGFRKSPVSELLIAKVLQQKSWAECSCLIDSTGRKQTESRLMKDMEELQANLQCKEAT